MINKKRILNIDNYLVGITEGEEFFIGCDVDQVNHENLEKVGFNTPVNEGDQVLPSILGPISEFNAMGGFIRERDKPKETKYRDAIIKDWHGDRHYVDIPYQRYHRIIINPPSVELKIVRNNNREIILSPQLIRNRENKKLIRHVFNLFLELFGYCYVLNKDLIPNIGNLPTKKVNWEILPKGEYPWERVKSLLNVYTKDLNNSRKTLIKRRMEVLNQYNPTNLIIGRGGFKGYWILGFENKNVYVLESLYYGNATYILGNDWEYISQLTKSEILQKELHEERIIHGNNWEGEIDKLLGS